MPGNILMNKDFREFIQSLNVHSVRYLIIGGYAVAFHGHPRYTKDLDIWIDQSVENAGNVAAAITTFGFGSSGLNASDFLEPDTVVQLGQPPNRIDIITSLKCVNFQSCYEHRINTEIDGVDFSFIDLDHLKVTKHAAGRHQDLADLENLE